LPPLFGDIGRESALVRGDAGSDSGRWCRRTDQRLVWGSLAWAVTTGGLRGGLAFGVGPRDRVGRLFMLVIQGHPLGCLVMAAGDYARSSLRSAAVLGLLVTLCLCSWAMRSQRLERGLQPHCGWFAVIAALATRFAGSGLCRRLSVMAGILCPGADRFRQRAKTRHLWLAFGRWDGWNYRLSPRRAVTASPPYAR